MTKKKLLKQLSFSSIALLAALAVTNQASPVVWAQEEGAAVTAPAESVPVADGQEESTKPAEEGREPKEGEPLETYRQYLLDFLNKAAKNHPDLLKKHQDLLSKSKTIQELADLYRHFQRELAQAQQKTLEQKIAEAEQEAYKIHGFNAIPNHTALIEVLLKSSSEDEIQTNLNVIREKAKEALALHDEKEATKTSLQISYPYLGEKLASYKNQVDAVTDKSQLQPIREAAEKDHKAILLTLIKETKVRFDNLKVEIKKLPELDANNPLYKDQRAIWSYLESSNLYSGVRAANDSQTHQTLKEIYEGSALYMEIVANIELSSRRAASYLTAFPTDAELMKSMKELFKDTYASIDGAHPGGNLYHFYHNEFKSLFAKVEARYQALKQVQEKPAPEDQPKDEPKKEVIPALPLNPADKIQSAVPKDAPVAEDKPIVIPALKLEDTAKKTPEVPKADKPAEEPKKEVIPALPLNPADKIQSAVPKVAPVAEDKPVHPLPKPEEDKDSEKETGKGKQALSTPEMKKEETEKKVLPKTNDTSSLLSLLGLSLLPLAAFIEKKKQVK